MVRARWPRIRARQENRSNPDCRDFRIRPIAVATSSLAAAKVSSLGFFDSAKVARGTVGRSLERLRFFRR